MIDDGDVLALDEIALTPGDRIDMPQVAFTHKSMGQSWLLLGGNTGMNSHFISS